jgi:hypothetical protein
MNRGEPERALSRRRFLKRCAVGTCLMPACIRAAAAADQPARPVELLYNEKAREAVQKALAYLAGRQNEDGSFGTGTYSRNAAVIGLCGMAFLADGDVPGRGRYGRHVARCLDFILAHTAENGFVSAAEGASRGPMYDHGFATLFLSEVYGMAPTKDVRDPLSRAVRLIIDTQNSEGGWRYEPRRHEADISVTVCQVMALRAAHNTGMFVPSSVIDRAVEYVKKCQNPDGGFMYQAGQPPMESLFPRSAAAIVALYSAGIYEGEEIRKGLEYLMRNPPRRNVQGEQSYYMYGHYYAVQAMWHAGGKFWQTWYPAIRDSLLADQRADGSWFDTISPDYGTAMATLVLHMPSNYLPIFQR